MKKTTFFILVLLPFSIFILFSIFKDDFSTLENRKYFLIFMSIYIFILNIIRLKNDGLSYIEIFKKNIPFYGMFDRYKFKK